MLGLILKVIYFLFYFYNSLVRLVKFYNNKNLSATKKIVRGPQTSWVRFYFNYKKIMLQETFITTSTLKLLNEKGNIL